MEETIRPWSWDRIQAHRKRYRLYKNLYKQQLVQPDNNNITGQLDELEAHLDIANILMAREQAKLEVGCSQYSKCAHIERWSLSASP